MFSFRHKGNTEEKNNGYCTRIVMWWGREAFLDCPTPFSTIHVYSIGNEYIFILNLEYLLQGFRPWQGPQGVKTYKAFLFLSISVLGSTTKNKQVKKIQWLIIVNMFTIFDDIQASFTLVSATDLWGTGGVCIIFPFCGYVAIHQHCQKMDVAFFF